MYEDREIRARLILQLIVAHPEEFVLGYQETDSGFGMTYDDDPESPRSQAYDIGLTLGEQEGY